MWTKMGEHHAQIVSLYKQQISNFPLGFIGSNIVKLLKKLGKKFIKLDTRLENIELLNEQLTLYKPKYVINSAGISGKPSVAWCENNKEETFLVNYTLQLQVADICKKLGIHLTIIGSGLLYIYGFFSEEYEPNFESFYYSKIRIMLEKNLDYSNILYLRFLYPIV